MKKATKIWLWAALALCLGTTALNLSEGRWLSVAIAAVSIAGLCVLLFTQRKAGYLVMCLCAVGSFLVGSAQNIQLLGAPTAILMTLSGPARGRGIAGPGRKSQWDQLR